MNKQINNNWTIWGSRQASSFKCLSAGYCTRPETRREGLNESRRTIYVKNWDPGHHREKHKLEDTSGKWAK